MERDYVLLATITALVMIFLPVVLYLTFQNIGYDSRWLSITYIAFFLVSIIIIIAWRIKTKKLPF